MARIDPSRQGGMDEPQDKFGVWRKKILDFEPSPPSSFPGGNAGAREI